MTVIQNGVVLHHKREYIGATDGIGGVSHLRWAPITNRIRPTCLSNCRTTQIQCATETSGFDRWVTMTTCDRRDGQKSLRPKVQFVDLLGRRERYQAAGIVGRLEIMA